MLRIAPLVLLVLLACACGGGDDDDGDAAPAPPPPPATNLQIQIWPNGRDRQPSPSTSWTLTCPAGGSLPNAEEACRRLNELGNRAFASTPKDVACAEVFGGPEVAEVRGTFRGDAVNTRFARNDSCEMERWKRVEFLFARSGPT